MVENIKKRMLEKGTKNFLLVASFVLGVVLFLIIFSSLPVSVIGDVNETVIVRTELIIGSVFPELLNVSIMDNAATFDLTGNSTTYLDCIGIMRDYDGEADFSNAYAEFFHNSSFFGDNDDNNTHYTNASCNISSSFGSWREHTDDSYLALANCTFQIQYYANPATWNCTMKINDTKNLEDKEEDLISISELLSIGLPNILNYGTVNATNVSDEQNVTVINYGNVEINLSLSGYGVTQYDNLSMNCSLGSLKNISIIYERFNITTSNLSILSLAQFNTHYQNLTSTPVTKKLDLNYRQSDASNEAFNNTFWRIYVPLGVAGTCEGNIEVSAVRAAGTL